MTAHAHYDTIARADPAALLDEAISYALGAVHAVTAQRLDGPTPCADWTLRALLLHVADSLAALCDGLGTGRLDLVGSSASSASALTAASCSLADALGAALDDPVASLRGQAARLRGVQAAVAEQRRPVLIAGAALDARIVLGVGAVELAVHGWDIWRTCGVQRPIPPELALELAGICALVVTADTRRPAFAGAVAVPRQACPSDQLVAYLGRDPGLAFDPL
jgi:uncharacterized protein (TIGR03086 family)